MFTALVLLVVTPCVVISQIDDLIDGQWLAPSLDILELRREHPLCLRCCDAHELTQIPGISQRLASSITRVISSGAVTSIQQLCDTLCCTPDQFVLLTSCTTLECSGVNIVRGADVRMRLPTSALGTRLARVNIEYALGRVGVVVAEQSNPISQIVGVWATAQIGWLSVALGDNALQVGSGLILGTARGLTRNVGDQALSIENNAISRPWQSTSRMGALTGISVHGQIPNTVLDVASCLSYRDVDGRKETISMMSVAGEAPYGNIRLSVLHANYNRPSESQSSSVITNKQSTLYSLACTHLTNVGTIVSELVLDDEYRVAFQAVYRQQGERTDFAINFWWYHPDLRSPFGSSIGGSSTPTNSVGSVVAYRIREKTFALELTGIHRRHVSRSFLTPLPTQETEIIADVSTRTIGPCIFSARIRYLFGEDSKTINTLRILDETALASARLDASVRLSKTVLGRIRVDVRRSWWHRADTTDNGSLMFVDLQWSATPSLRLSVRWSQFASSSGTIAPRMMEVGVAGSMQTVVGNGRGARWMIGVRWAVTAWATASCAFHQDRRVIDGQLITDRSALFQIDLRLRATGRREFIAVDDEPSSRLE